MAVLPLATVAVVEPPDPVPNVTGSTPTPERLRIERLLDALSETVNDPVLCPAMVGAKVTAIAQEAPETTVAPQALVTEKSPFALTEFSVSEAFPVFVRLIVCAALEDPIATLPKLKPDGARFTAGI